MTERHKSSMDDALELLSKKYHTQDTELPETLWPSIVSEIRKKEAANHKKSIWTFFNTHSFKLVSSMACLIVIIGMSSYVSLKNAEDQAISFIMENMVDDTSVTLLLDVFDE